MKGKNGPPGQRLVLHRLENHPVPDDVPAGLAVAGDETRFGFEKTVGSRIEALVELVRECVAILRVDAGQQHAERKVAGAAAQVDRSAGNVHLSHRQAGEGGAHFEPGHVFADRGFGFLADDAEADVGGDAFDPDPRGRGQPVVEDHADHPEHSFAEDQRDAGELQFREIRRFPRQAGGFARPGRHRERQFAPGQRAQVFNARGERPGQQAGLVLRVGAALKGKRVFSLMESPDPHQEGPGVVEDRFATGIQHPGGGLEMIDGRADRGSKPGDRRLLLPRRLESPARVDIAQDAGPPVRLVGAHGQFAPEMLAGLGPQLQFKNLVRGRRQARLKVLPQGFSPGRMGERIQSPANRVLDRVPQFARPGRVEKGHDATLVDLDHDLVQSSDQFAIASLVGREFVDQAVLNLGLRVTLANHQSFPVRAGEPTNRDFSIRRGQLRFPVSGERHLIPARRPPSAT